MAGPSGGGKEKREKATEVDDSCSCRGKEDEVVERGMGRLRAVANGKNWVGGV